MLVTKLDPKVTPPVTAVMPNGLLTCGVEAPVDAAPVLPLVGWVTGPVPEFAGAVAPTPVVGAAMVEAAPLAADGEPETGVGDEPPAGPFGPESSLAAGVLGRSRSFNPLGESF